MRLINYFKYLFSNKRTSKELVKQLLKQNVNRYNELSDFNNSFGSINFGKKLGFDKVIIFYKDGSKKKFKLISWFIHHKHIKKNLYNKGLIEINFLLKNKIL